MSSSFGEDIERHYEGSDADVLPPTSDIEESKEEKEKQYQKEYHKRYFQEKQNSPYTCYICGKTLANSSNIKRHEKAKNVNMLKAKYNWIILENIIIVQFIIYGKTNK